MRIRTIKPDFWRSEDVAQLNYFDRLLFIGLWSYVDDNGVGRDNIRLLVSDLFPLEEDPAEITELVAKGMNQIADAESIVRYVVAKRPYFYVLKWTKHQRINRPTRSMHPLPPEHLRGIVTEGSGQSQEDSRTLHEDSVRTHGGFSEGSLPGSGSARGRAGSEPPLPGSGIREQGEGIREKESMDPSVNHLQVVGADGKEFTIDPKSVATITKLTGGDLAHVRATAEMILDRAPGQIRTPGAYIVAAINQDPDAYRRRKRAPTKSEQCDLHPGQYADSCAGCAADRIAGDYP